MTFTNKICPIMKKKCIGNKCAAYSDGEYKYVNENSHGEIWCSAINRREERRK